MLKTIKLIMILLLAFFSICIFSVFSGVKISSISLGNFYVSQLYLKLDKKLILEIDEINVSMKKTSSKSSSDDLLNNLTKFPYILEIFQKIEINNLKIKDNYFTISFDEEHLYLDNKYVNLSAQMDYNEPKVKLDVYSIYLKDIDLTLFGKSKIDLDKKIMSFHGNYVLKEKVEGELSLKLDENYFDFYLNGSKTVKSIAFLKDFFRLDEVAEAWMYDNVEGDIDLKYLKGRIDIQKLEPILNSIEGNVKIHDAKIRFHKDAKTVNTNELNITYKNDKLSFDLEKPVYNKSKIYGSRVYISDLTSLEKGTVVVDLKTKSMLNDDILEILKAYEIKLPLKQSSGKTDSTLVLSIPYLASKKMSVDGLFKVQDAVLNLEDFEFSTPKADVVLKDNIVSIKKSRVIHKDMLDAFLELDINTSNSKAYGHATINKFLIDTKDDGEIINIKDFDTSVSINFKDATTISLDNLNADIGIKEKGLEVGIHDISIANKYSKVLSQLKFKKGDILLDIKDENNISFKANLEDLDLPIQKDGKKLKNASIKGNIKGDNSLIQSLDGNIVLKIQDGNKTLKLSNLDLNLEGEGKSENLDIPSFDIELENSTVILDKKTFFKNEWARITIDKNRINFEALSIDLELPLAKDMKAVEKLHVKGSYANSVVNVKSLDNNLTLTYEAKKDKLIMDVKNYDVTYDTSLEEDKSSTTQYYITGTKSNIIINNEFVAKADTYKFVFADYKTFVDLKYKDTIFNYSKDFAGNIKVEAKNMSDEFLNALANKELIRGGKVNLSASGESGILKGTAYMKDTTIRDLAILNNLLIFINTSPALINPLLAVPSVVGMATNDGFDLRGYKVSSGKLEFTYNFEKKFLNVYKLFTKGNGIDFDGYLTVDFLNDKINSKLKLIFFKDYSKIVGAIPVINYIFLGDEKQVSTQVDIYGTLKDPKFKTNVAKDSAKAPINVIKRIITSPIKLLEEIKDSFK